MSDEMKDAATEAAEDALAEAAASDALHEDAVEKAAESAMLRDAADRLAAEAIVEEAASEDLADRAEADAGRRRGAGRGRRGRRGLTERFESNEAPQEGRLVHVPVTGIPSSRDKVPRRTGGRVV